MATCSDCGAEHTRPRAVRCSKCSIRRQKNSINAWKRKQTAIERAQNPIFCCDCNVQITDRAPIAKRCLPCSKAETAKNSKLSAERCKARKEAAAEKVRAEVVRLRSLSMPGWETKR